MPNPVSHDDGPDLEIASPSVAVGAHRVGRVNDGGLPQPFLRRVPEQNGEDYDVPRLHLRPCGDLQDEIYTKSVGEECVLYPESVLL